MQGMEAELRLQVIETSWRCNAEFRESGSPFAQEVDRWIRNVREPEERERQRVESYRDSQRADEEAKAKMHGDMDRGKKGYFACRMAGNLDGEDNDGTENNWNLDQLSEGSSDESEGDRNVRMAERRAMMEMVGL